jgi:hypothetical protein
VAQIRGNRRAANLINSQVKQIKQMLESKKTDGQIMETLRIPNRTYYRYKRRITNEDKQQWAKVVKESLESRALKILQSLQWAYFLNKKIAEDQTAQASIRIKASQVMIDTQVNIYYLLKRGPRLVTKV